MARNPMSRRTFLKGSGVFIGLPFLEAMMPRLAWSAVPGAPRLVVVYGGVPTYFQQRDLPIGALTSSLPSAISSLGAVRQHVSVITNVALPLYSGTQTPAPGSALAQQHYTAPAPSLAGKTTIDSKPMMYQCHTVDQVFADVAGTASKFKSLQACVQAAPYNGKVQSTSHGGQVSSRFVNGTHNVLQPIVSPLALWDKLFAGFTGPGVPPPSALVSADKSVLDVVLDDANRIQASLSGADKIRLEQHFEEIRAIERRLSATAPSPGGGGGNCSSPTKPSADVQPSTYNFGGWASETIRRDQQADILAMALICDMTRSLSWQLTFDQCFLGAANISGVMNNELHQISHDVTSDPSGMLRIALAEHYDWHCAGFARLVGKLANAVEGSGTVLDSTFLGMCMGEGTNAHNRTTMHLIMAGCKNEMKLGQHIAGASGHPARMWIAGLNALGVNNNNLGEISGAMTSLLK